MSLFINQEFSFFSLVILLLDSLALDFSFKSCFFAFITFQVFRRLEFCLNSDTTLMQIEQFSSSFLNNFAKLKKKLEDVYEQTHSRIVIFKS